MKIYLLLLVNQLGQIEIVLAEVSEGFTLMDWCKYYYPGWYLHTYKDVTQQIFDCKITLLAEQLQ